MNKREEIRWYPMRITYKRELKIKQCLDEYKIENFLPMQYVFDEVTGERMLKPALHNLIFVKSSQETLTNLKMTKREFEPMRYIMKGGNTKLRRGGTILYVPDREMDKFLRVASINDDRVIFLETVPPDLCAGQKVRINKGTFSGIEGTIKRIKNNKRVVVHIEGVAAVAIAYVPTNYLEKI